MRGTLFTTATAALALAAFGGPAAADIVTQTVTYDVDGTTYEGYFAINDGIQGDQPVVLIVHDWDGLTDYEKRRAEMLAEYGVAAFAVDVYGQGVRPTTTEDKRAESGKLYQDRDALRARLAGGLEAALQMDGVEDDVIVIGYCFGGAAALEFARAGADVDGFVSFHGGLGTPDGQDYSEVEAPILILHGSEDPVAPMAQVAALAEAMNADNVDFEMQIYSGARHSFTEWSAKGEGSRYDANADLKSWQALLSFIDEQVD
ncbi:dienelactone hydrolase family protein [Amorphus orientalis]|uniref:Dienelactone hydrolase n=1 Tax=Amorphus orientalis TaxID=649198 RepID=A0AAE3VKT4_9HYPH|nr:dienelactone hydrolase family protein [Amorphus orientalis]MDQ0313822.1 dienelactone hydrolase [Amorphus orientalis]